MSTSHDMDKYAKIWAAMGQDARLQIANMGFRQSEWKKLWKRRSACTLGFESYAEMRTFAKYARSEGVTRGMTALDIGYTISDALMGEDWVPAELLVMHSPADITGSYEYNPDDDEYFIMGLAGEHLYVPGERVRRIQAAYSNEGSKMTLGRVAESEGMSKPQLRQLLKALGITHDSLPFTDEYVATESEDALVSDLLALKRNKVRVKAQKAEFAAVTRDATRYRAGQNLAEALNDHISTTGPTYQPPKLPIPLAERPFSAIIPLADFHWGKWGADRTGNPYNRVTAKARLAQATSDLAARLASRGTPERIALVMLGDGLHIDNMQSTTTRGTAQHTDGDPELLISTWFDLMRDWVDMWRQIAPIDLYIIPGNHDRLMSAALRAAMRAWFHTADDVSVVETLSHRQYLQIGDASFMFVHGDSQKPNSWVEMFAREAAPLWGATKHRYILHGHFHTMRSIGTYSGTEVIGCPSLSGSCTWEYNSGYPPTPSTLMLIVDKEDGVVSREMVRA